MDVDQRLAECGDRQDPVASDAALLAALQPTLVDFRANLFPGNESLFANVGAREPPLDLSRPGRWTGR